MKINSAEEEAECVKEPEGMEDAKEINVLN